MKKLIAICTAAMIAPLVEAAIGDTSDPTFVYVNPKSCYHWHTATNSTMTLPIDYPSGVTNATLTVSGAGYALKTYPNLNGNSFELALPVLDSPLKENVYDLTLTFNDGTVRKAKIGLIQSFALDSECSTRCLAPAEGDAWNTVKKQMVLPIPYGTELLTMSVNGGAWTEVDTGLDGAGWYALKPATDDSVSLSLAVDGVDYAATLIVKGDGFCIIVK